jgi:putative hydrolase of the HAD superfamily
LPGSALNIVFDLGGVVFNWQPDTIIKSAFEDPETQQLVRAGVFEHSDWIELDRGSLSFEHAVDRGARRTGLPPGDIEQLLSSVPIFLTPIEETIELIHQLAGTANRLFVLSNMQLASIAYLEQQHDIWELFDGIVISSRIQMVKPELRIFEYLLARHELDPAETVFIDDMEENVAAASSMGIETIRFLDAAQCRKALEDLSCI